MKKGMLVGGKIHGTWRLSGFKDIVRMKLVIIPEFGFSNKKQCSYYSPRQTQNKTKNLHIKIDI